MTLEIGEKAKNYFSLSGYIHLQKHLHFDSTYTVPLQLDQACTWIHKVPFINTYSTLCTTPC